MAVGAAGLHARSEHGRDAWCGASDAGLRGRDQRGQDVQRRGAESTQRQTADGVRRSVGKRFGALVESLGTTPVPIVVERAMYRNANGQPWAAGTNAPGTKLQ